MLIPLERFSDAYERIKVEASPGGNTVLILVSPNTDALAACRILTDLLKQDDVLYNVRPVGGFDDLAAVNEAFIVGNEELRSVIMLNCGGIVDISEIVSLFEPDGTPTPLRVFIADSHRPLHLSNAYAGNVLLFEDGHVEQTIPDLPDAPEGGEDSDTDAPVSSDTSSGSEDEPENSLPPEPSLSHPQSDQSSSHPDMELVAQDSSNGSAPSPVAPADMSLGSSTSSSSRKRARPIIEDDEDEDEDDSGHYGSSTNLENVQALGNNASTSAPGSKETPAPPDAPTLMDDVYDAGDSDSEAELREELSSPSKRPRTSSQSSQQEVEFTPQSKYERRAVRAARRARRAARLEARAALQEYYRGSYHGAPVALLMYLLASQKNRANTDTLWLAILGVTDQFIHEHTTPEAYADYYGMLQSQVDLRSMAPEEHALSGSGAGASALVASRESGSITTTQEYRFMLYRHWTLYDSLFHSPFVASRLGIWKEQGRTELATFFARMGLPLDQVKQRFKSMPPDVRSRLREQIDLYAPEFGLDGIVFNSFTLQQGWRNLLSAPDVVYAVSALLEYPDQSELHVDLAADAAPQDITLLRSSSNIAPINGLTAGDGKFWTAYDALSPANSQLLQEGLTKSISLQQALVRVATQLVETRRILFSGSFRYAFIQDHPDAPLFTHPLSLTKLALFLMDILREGGRTTRPVLLLALNPISATYIVCGITGGPRFGSKAHNTFGISFRKAAEISSARIKHDTFETSILELQRDDAPKFLDALHSSLVTPPRVARS